MPVSIRLVAFALLAGFSSANGVSAQTVAGTATQWGLIGVWQLDCKAPISQSNGALKYAVRGGKLFHDRDFGGGKTDSNVVISARANSDETLEVTISFASFSQTRQFAFVKAADGRIRALNNRNVDTDEYSIRDGKFLANGNVTPWQSRCAK
ncbi:MAG: hypothetical protein Q8N31_14290 [Reyranella sp.]|nr:hypothetical protein [Reyranella sp.]MDP3161186.1 hypothetical protein [Reyranella sp.]